MTASGHADPGLPWLQVHQDRLGVQLEQGLVPHALLMHGPSGVGRSVLAAWLVQRLLPRLRHTGAGESDPDDPLAGFCDPDYACVEPGPDSRAITVEQIRDLTRWLQLTSHHAGRKVAVLRPAESMNHAACNSLLKTLEEPPGPATLILVTSAPARLPATIVSRCQRIRLTVPALAAATDWLQRFAPGPDWAELLSLSGGAPMRARRLAQEGSAEATAGLARDLGDLLAQRTTATAVARRWAGGDLRLCMAWLYGQISAQIHTALLPGRATAKSGTRHLTKAENVKDLYGVLDRIVDLGRLLDRPLSHELQLADLLAAWAPGAIGKE